MDHIPRGETVQKFLDLVVREHCAYRKALNRPDSESDQVVLDEDDDDMFDCDELELGNLADVLNGELPILEKDLGDLGKIFSEILFDYETDQIITHKILSNEIKNRIYFNCC
jgi:hypothetical protein